MNLTNIIDQLNNLDNGLTKLSNLNKNYTIDFINELKAVMFSKVLTSNVTINQLYLELEQLLKQINCEDVNKTLNDFFINLPIIKETLLTDIEVFIKNDPACKSKEEVIFTYNSFFAVFVYRIANLMTKLKIKILPRFLSEYAHSVTGVDINPNATIGHSFFIDHGTGIVIGETTIIGNNVSIYQGVTLGAKNLKDIKTSLKKKRHPTILDNVIIYANATILGGDTIIGQNSIIGSSCFITKSVMPNSKIKFKD